MNLSTSILFDTQTTCANVLQDAGTDIYMYCKKPRLIYWSTAAAGAVLKTKGDHMTSPFLRIHYMVIYYDSLLGMYAAVLYENGVHG